MPRSRPEKKLSPAALKPALDPMAIMWGQFFNRFIIRMDGSWPVASARDVEEAYEFWRMIPDLERRRCWPFNGPAADRLGRGFGWHRVAEQILMAAAERLGLDPSPIHESGDICYNLLLRRPRMAYKTTSTLIAYWPHCLGPRLAGLSPQEKEAVRKAEGVLARLLVKIRLKPNSGTALTLTPAAAVEDDRITASVAEQDFYASRSTLRAAVADGRLTDLRPASKKGTTSPLILSRTEVGCHFTQRKK